jgi:hypothetical protein
MESRKTKLPFTFAFLFERGQGREKELKDE